MIKIYVIVPYFGLFPEYLPYFLLCCSYNPGIHWLIFTDQEKPLYCPENISYSYMSLEGFNKLATNKLGFPVEIDSAHKLCDFKPAYGLIFEDFIKEYEFWGFCDIDILLGDIFKFLSLSKLKKSDIISTYQGYISGTFSLFRNNDKINNLFRISPGYQSILQDKQHYAFDENFQRKDIKGFSFKKLVYFFYFILVSISKFRFYSFNFSEFRYQFQWFYKKNSILKGIPSDMTEIVLSHSKDRDIKVCFTPIMLTDSYFRRIGKKKWSIVWTNGKLHTPKNGREIFGFHYMESKKNKEFLVKPFDPSIVQFSLSPTGIQ
jgi:hypothetical protein